MRRDARNSVAQQGHRQALTAGAQRQHRSARHCMPPAVHRSSEVPWPSAEESGNGAGERHRPDQRRQLKAGADLDLVGKADPYAELCRLFDRQTEQGRAMGLYSDLLAASVEAVTTGFQRKLADGLQSGRHFVIPNLAEQVSPDSRFELVTWLVILEAGQPP